MKKKNWLFWLLVVIAAMTAVTGAVQAIAPAFVLHFVGAQITKTSQHFFAIVGMFMVLFGGATLQALLSVKHHPIVIFWSSLQKFGASVAVALSVMNGVFSSLAVVVAVVDFLSGVLAIAYWLRIRREG
ncbi:MAG TPA: hypothetical protein VJT50_07450 [Pyrinomonadaceae bacterium]|nr:hypothetical protein [Pyrinomonadaceae bacterium]